MGMGSRPAIVPLVSPNIVNGHQLDEFLGEFNVV
jgi:hypothetical protein